MNRFEPVSALPGIGEKRARALRGMGIVTIGDLLDHIPRDYDDRSEVKTVAMLTPGQVNVIRGYVMADAENISFQKANAKTPLVMTKIKIKDETGVLEIVWFGQPYLKQYFVKHQAYIFTGMVGYADRTGGSVQRLQMKSPDYEQVGEKELLSSGRIVPVYTTTAQLSQKVFRGLIKKALDTLEDDWPDDLPVAIRQAYELCARKEAVQNIHFPDNDAAFFSARRRLVFEELFFMQSALLRLKGHIKNEPGAVLPDLDYGPLTALLPFDLTDAQTGVLAEITADMQSGSRMNRLIQGDVGSGKTAVAMIAAYLCIKNGYQAAIMAPTEVLAEQHYRAFTEIFAPLSITTALLTGSQPRKNKNDSLASVRDGQAQMIVGTHALIQKGVQYKNLALVITDEQHRFGVNQRAALGAKGGTQQPHILVMTATPIPRTLGLILFGDMDISVIDRLPPGRQVIKTYCVTGAYRARIHAFIQKEAEKGRQAYIICPSIDATPGDTAADKKSIHAVNQYAEALQSALPALRVAPLHGKMTPGEKQTTMNAFLENRIQVLVATTVIEVGVHVANATLMIVENADRFGLSQLHQLRGRVGRGSEQSYCILISDTQNPVSRARMKAMETTTDGFVLSEMDLKLRGPGDFFGVQQHGLPSFTIANLYRDMAVLQEANTAAAAVLENQISVAPEDIPAFERRVEAVFRRVRVGSAVAL